ncbi:unnamed protein product [Calypogeia fissa]
MAHQAYIIAAVLLLVCCTLANWPVLQAADPELLTDFSPPANGAPVNASFFTNHDLQGPFLSTPSKGELFVDVTLANVMNFPALNGLGVSTALLLFSPGAVNPPHTHPRGTEVIFVIEGCLDVGLVLSNTTLFTQTLNPGDLFVFPRGLVHFQINWGKNYQEVKAFASFSSAAPGLVRLPNVLFKSGISDDILAQSFGVSPNIIETLKAGDVENPPAK